MRPSRFIFALLSAGVPLVPIEAASAGQDPISLSPFEVSSSRDHGYVATNALSATRVGTSILDTPLTIQVLTADLLDDLHIRDFAEIGDYVAGFSSATGHADGQGSYRIRAFDPAVRLRNGFVRPTNYSYSNVARIEIAKGPVSTLFGRAQPGGVINYITKRPEFRSSGSFTYTLGSYGSHEADLALNHAISKTVALRVHAFRDDSDDWREFEFRDLLYITPAVVWQPNRKFSLWLEYEYGDFEKNQPLRSPVGNPQFFADYAAPPADVQAGLGMTAAQLRSRWRTARVTWINDIERVRGTRPASITQAMPELLPGGPGGNISGPDQRWFRRSHSYTGEAVLSPIESVNVRYGFNHFDYSRSELIYQGQNPNADGTFDLRAPNSNRNEIGDVRQHQLDLLFTHHVSWVKSRLLVGASRMDSNTTVGSFGLTFDQVPAVTDVNGAPLTGANALRFHDPLRHPRVRLSQISTGPRPFSVASNGSRASTDGYFISHQGEWLDGRLFSLLGVRREDTTSQAYRNLASASLTEAGDTTYTFGLTYHFTPNLVVYTSRSTSFNPNFGTAVTGPGALVDEGGRFPFQAGLGTELGVKTDWRDHTLSGTLNVFELERNNILRNDALATESDPRNIDNDPNNNVSIRRAGGRERSRGLELDLAWTPVKNYQVLVSGAWMWEAALIADPSLVPGTFRQRRLMSGRLTNAPEYTFSTWHRYTFTRGSAKGLTLGLGANYSSSTSAVAGDPDSYFDFPSVWVLNGLIRYEMKLLGRETQFSLSLKNITDKLYQKGNTLYADPFKAFASVRLKF